MASESAGPSEGDCRGTDGTAKENRLDQAIGPFYDTKGVAVWLKVSRSTLYRRIARREILGLKTADGRYLYPQWQFDEEGRTLSGLAEVLKAMDPCMTDPWGDALWLCTKASFLDGERPIDKIRSGQFEAVLHIAARIGAIDRDDCDKFDDVLP